jgi:hypothetical protein
MSRLPPKHRDSQIAKIATTLLQEIREVSANQHSADGTGRVRVRGMDTATIRYLVALWVRGVPFSDPLRTKEQERTQGLLPRSPHLLMWPTCPPEHPGAGSCVITVQASDRLNSGKRCTTSTETSLHHTCCNLHLLLENPLYSLESGARGAIRGRLCSQVVQLWPERLHACV